LEGFYPGDEFGAGLLSVVRAINATVRRAGKAKRARVFCGGHGHSALKTRVNALSLRLCPAAYQVILRGNERNLL
jgi:hypothetical protein